jgi:hypothetical protein
MVRVKVVRPEADPPALLPAVEGSGMRITLGVLAASDEAGGFGAPGYVPSVRVAAAEAAAPRGVIVVSARTVAGAATAAGAAGTLHPEAAGAAARPALLAAMSRVAEPDVGAGRLTAGGASGPGVAEATAAPPRYDGSPVRPAAAPVPGGGTVCRPKMNGSLPGGVWFLLQPASKATASSNAMDRFMGRLLSAIPNLRATRET